MPHLGAGTGSELEVAVGLEVEVGFRPRPASGASSSCTIEWSALRACQVHCAFCTAGPACPRMCTWDVPATPDSLQASCADCLPQPLAPLDLAQRPPADCHTERPTAHPSFCG